VLFICGGTFDGLDDVIAHRLKGHKPGNGKAQRPAPMAQVAPDDLMHYGLIPEFVGRLPVVVTLEPLDHAGLMAVLTQPRNALVKQYERLFAMDSVELAFTPDALERTVELALQHQTGARGLRSILERTLLDVMYEVPSRSDVRRVVVNGEAIASQSRPLLFGDNGRAVGWGEDALQQAA
jgi:ATP-dependent Clp protease ATP-binding subunit ClpX